jgi:hypothetical protein
MLLLLLTAAVVPAFKQLTTCTTTTLLMRNELRSKTRTLLLMNSICIDACTDHGCKRTQASGICST